MEPYVLLRKSESYWYLSRFLFWKKNRIEDPIFEITPSFCSALLSLSSLYYIYQNCQIQIHVAQFGLIDEETNTNFEIIGGQNRS